MVEDLGSCVVSRPSRQVGFFTIIVQPTFALMAELQHPVKERWRCRRVLYHPAWQDVLLAHLQSNTETWEARKRKEPLGCSKEAHIAEAGGGEGELMKAEVC